VQTASINADFQRLEQKNALEKTTSGLDGLEKSPFCKENLANNEGNSAKIGL